MAAPLIHSATPGASQRRLRNWRRISSLGISAASLLCGAASAIAAGMFAPGDSVRLTRSETLLFKGQNLVGAPKGQEFVTLKEDFSQGIVYVGFVKEDGSLIAVTLPAATLELAPPNGWMDLLQGTQAFRDQRYEDARRLLTRARQDSKSPSLDGQSPSLNTLTAVRILGAINSAVATRRTQSSTLGFIVSLDALRQTAEQLNAAGYYSLALPLDEGADHCAAQIFGATPPLPAAGGPSVSKLDRADLTKRVATSQRAAARARQAIALHRLTEASKSIDEGLAAEPARPDLKAFRAAIKKDLAEADSHYENANSMRRHVGGTVHALTALEMGLKVCADHPGLRELKKDMQSAFEERTSPPVTAAFLAAAKVSTSSQALTEGHKLYTTRCTECHDLELVDSRSISGWQKMVGSMSRRAHLNDDQQARILEYLAAAENTMDTGKP